VELTEQDDGSTVNVPSGSEITVRLREARTGGYQWMLDEAGNGVVALASEEFHPGARPGGHAVHEFRFVTVGRGTATLRLVHRRPWSKDDPGAGRWQVDVDVIGSIG
jgi:predicted secreted protein